MGRNSHNSGRKAVIHCHDIATVFRAFVYLWKSQPTGPRRLRRVQMYHSLRSSEDNEEILRLLEDDPLCQVVIATVAFSNWLNTTLAIGAQAILGVRGGVKAGGDFGS